MDTNGTGSLAARAKARREALLDQHSTTIEVPGYEGVLAVEYRALGYAETRKIAARHQRQSDEATQELYIASDQLIAASINAYELHDDGTREELGVGWGLGLASMLGVDTDGLTPRQAMFGCFARDVFVTRHWADYIEWLSSAQADVDEVQRADFQPMTSPSSPTTP